MFLFIEFYFFGFVRGECMLLNEIGFYKIICILGCGGMGMVYEVLYELEVYLVVLKVFVESYVDDDYFWMWFVVEIEILLKLDYENIVKF